jgi:hypothetical protein
MDTEPKAFECAWPGAHEMQRTASMPSISLATVRPTAGGYSVDCTRLYSGPCMRSDGRDRAAGGKAKGAEAVAMPVSVGVGRGSRRAMCRRGWPIRSQRRFSLGTVCRASVLYAARSDAVQDRAINGACQGAVRVDTMHGRTPCDGRRTRRIVHGMGGSSSHALFAPPERIAVRTGGVRGFHACIDTLDRLGPPWTACRAPICWGWSRCRSTTSVMHAPQERWMKGRSTESVLIGWWRTRT